MGREQLSVRIDPISRDFALLPVEAKCASDFRHRMTIINEMPRGKAAIAVGIGEMLSGGNEAVGPQSPTVPQPRRASCFSRIDPFAFANFASGGVP